MTKKTDLINVFLNDIFVGRLVLNKNNLAVFEYDKKWIEIGFSISPFYLPLRSGAFTAKANPFNGLFGVFNDSLPDGWGKLLIDRYLKECGINPNNLNVLDLLSIIGKNGMGALSYIPENEIIPNIFSNDIDFFATEINKVIKLDSHADLKQLIAKNGSSAGVRPKIIINYLDELWLVKFPALYDDDSIGKTEFSISQIAKKCGIETPETYLFKDKYFGSKLFDRKNNEKYHTHTVSGLLYADHRLPSLDYEDILKLTLALTKNNEEVEKAYKLMIFNILIENKDDHSKNFSFIYKNNKWQLSPAYDITKSTGFNGNHTTTILGKGNPNKNDIINLGIRIGLSKSRINFMYNSIFEIIKNENI